MDEKEIKRRYQNWIESGLMADQPKLFVVEIEKSLLANVLIISKESSEAEKFVEEEIANCDLDFQEDGCSYYSYEVKDKEETKKRFGEVTAFSEYPEYDNVCVEDFLETRERIVKSLSCSLEEGQTIMSGPGFEISDEYK